MTETQKNNPLHGYTLETIITYLQLYYGWEKLYEQIPANCFKINPSIKSAVTFMRKTPWARTKAENTFIYLTRKGVDERFLVVKVKKVKPQ